MAVYGGAAVGIADKLLTSWSVSTWSCLPSAAFTAPSGHNITTCWVHLTSFVAFSEASEALTASNSSKNAASLCNALICTPSTATVSSKAISSFTLGLSCTHALCEDRKTALMHSQAVRLFHNEAVCKSQQHVC